MPKDSWGREDRRVKAHEDAALAERMTAPADGRLTASERAHFDRLRRERRTANPGVYLQLGLVLQELITRLRNPRAAEVLADTQLEEGLHRLCEELGVPTHPGAPSYLLREVESRLSSARRCPSLDLAAKEFLKDVQVCLGMLPNPGRESLGSGQEREKFIAGRGIDSLWHFTDIKNLESILRHGLLPRATLSRRGIRFSESDPDRYDGCTDTVSLSISFPNGTMFWDKRCQDPSRGWCLLRLSWEVLRTTNALFCTVNAASHLALPHSDLEALFAEDRRAPDLLPRFPTNEQAEVLISEQIPQGLILEILVQAKEGPIRDLDDPRIRIDPDAAEWNTRNFAMSQDRFRAHFMRG
jgi:hypothetical protein